MKNNKEYNKQNKLIKETSYKRDGKTIYYIDEFNSNNGNPTKTTNYYNNGTIDYIKEIRSQHWRYN
ncbi:DUF2963 domain-containing protein ['Fragaria x ananassa' phyllody phytoplasma]|uniref:DUF2963 domain-containing protein n=1 Tax='Fragaria x ananassa' phyllody phytoplasma TaxID=2358428 RepID=A0ABS5K3V3_9MOLU|nr:DUF2963 domain-containing protein ['Fragaria x ananassa' phyllody phytoplasma]